MSTRILSAGIGALLLAGTSTPSFAANWVSDISLSHAGGILVVGVKNVSPIKTVAAVNLQPTSQSVAFDLNGSVQCANGSKLVQTYLHFGSDHAWGKISLGTNFNGFTEAVHTQVVNVYPNEQTRPQSQAFNKNFIVPLAVAKNGPHGKRFNPVELIEAGLAQHVQNGGSAAAYLKQNHTYSQDVKLSVLGTCDAPGSHTYGTMYGETWVRTITVNVMVNYQGDPNIIGGPGPDASPNTVLVPGASGLGKLFKASGETSRDRAVKANDTPEDQPARATVVRRAR